MDCPIGGTADVYAKRAIGNDSAAQVVITEAVLEFGPACGDGSVQ